MTNVLYQHGTLGTLMAGLLEGTATINELLEHGNLGIATLTGSAGFHIHFADDERAYGGHVLDFEVDDVVVEIQNFETFQQHFPVNNETFVKAKIDYKDVAEEIREAE
ncbi:TPA: acetolactate decarboxylase [Staphylococcus aureus]|nr:acetolactate decarboxylase [Staphylococcus aureus]HEJ8286380.1 acetolactate decarboxylase [Staphylococcus aureus]HEJ8559836.1 acetolactate decarboxylase [Staphylococcus aureus]HEJ9328272.1 acetolactate decarboxylase [Staphylococcus aureus]